MAFLDFENLLITRKPVKKNKEGFKRIPPLEQQNPARYRNRKRNKISDGN